MTEHQLLSVIHSEICYCRDDISFLRKELSSHKEKTGDKLVTCRTEHDIKIKKVSDSVVQLKFSILKIIAIACASGIIGGAGAQKILALLQ